MQTILEYGTIRIKEELKLVSNLTQAYNKPKAVVFLVKKVFSIITFAISIVAFSTLVLLTYDMIKEYNYINSLPSTSGSDYLGFLFYRMFFCVTALPGIISSSVCLKISSTKPLKAISIILLSIFIMVFIAFGIAWLNLL